VKTGRGRPGKPEKAKCEGSLDAKAMVNVAKTGCRHLDRADGSFRPD
jgi:hypothetical protein